MSRFTTSIVSLIFTLGFWIWFAILLNNIGWTPYSVAILIIAASWSILSIDYIVTAAIEYIRRN